jgi:hypothetical protein
MGKRFKFDVIMSVLIGFLPPTRRQHPRLDCEPSIFENRGHLHKKVPGIIQSEIPPGVYTYHDADVDIKDILS